MENELLPLDPLRELKSRGHLAFTDLPLHGNNTSLSPLYDAYVVGVRH